ncbi:hypothetical protein [Roseateles sp. YR242]|uniref:hypothetical protein n=1 Tax=Roseateles sp. YR242 TaxID=1855305 RepID=UPI0011607B5E|nr:hypothetical protein [Roseateles sp. YR242]
MMQKNDFIAAFSRLGSGKELSEFIAQHHLSTAGLDQKEGAQVYQIVGGTIEGAAAVITHRWYDPSGPYQNQPDIAKAELDIDGKRVATVSWIDS